MPLGDGQFGLALPLRHLGLLLLEFAFQQMLVRDCDSHLRLYLHQLILHIQYQLLQQPLRILGLLDQVIQIRP